jgi:drug/metabolite transporter (DMT)-like permease
MRSGVVAALAAAALFGAGTPLAKVLLGHMSPWLLAALLYLGSGIGLWVVRRLTRAQRVSLAPGEWAWLSGAVLAGGVVGPVLLMLGLTHMPASGASLLLNAEGVFTALIAWFVFKENFDRRIALGMLAIVAGSVVLVWPGSMVALGSDSLWPALAVLVACLAWGIDNNLTRKVSLADATWVAMVKGLCAGAVNLVLALAWAPDTAWPGATVVGAAALLGLASYGASLSLFVVALRHLGTARTGAYFSVAPFWGAVLAVALLGEPVTGPLLLAGALMALGVGLHLTERHAHDHTHTPLDHQHMHTHGAGDDHHDHPHSPAVPPGTRHSHPHHHAPLVHTHLHFPDAHHQHRH